ncbi:efflux transporter, RND family, MFP subunit [Pseudooceanicola batsensis HTCC2597]|uniref:Efflux transporter, RND family, MFP subunit n=1 Tax=Pseudooceanicola batsensis (strain ATCC BAA-863 / DSM 15984 / KCTC 12145 / HTCC2597) TaxID=252305 RepID=A3U3T4_PSEBH|nr:efflux RND transporter periplasmic adaptor subunit [Pseudooceanicola batsensis]EAQ01173.1 efflux transporter, RND family, MFP subunit [Pseudooceanicola batsensis HTCC2597]
MRIIPILSAILVTAFLYAIVIQRDAIMAFAQGEGLDTAIAIARGEEAEGDDAPVQTAAVANETVTDARPAAEAATVGEPSEPEAVRVVTILSQAREIDGAVVLRGQTEADRSVELRAETSGTVVSDPIRKGARVSEGDLICELDPGTRQDSLTEAEARLAEARATVPSAEARVEEAKARVAEAEINENAAQKLSQGGFASDTRVASSAAAKRSAEAALAQAESGLATAQAAIRSAEAAVASTRRELERTKIHAPFGGLLEHDTAEIGSLLQNGGLCATIIQLDPIKLVGFIPETEVDRVETGAQAGARLAAGGGQLAGKVTFLSRSADPQTRTFRVEIQVPNPDLAIRDGQTAEIAISAPGTKAHLVPQSALTLNDDGALGVRVVGPGNIAGFEPVTILRDTTQGAWINGPPDEAQIIIIGQDYVIDGVPVNPSVRDQTQ